MVLEDEYRAKLSALEKKLGDVQKARGREAAKASVQEQHLEEQVEKLKREVQALQEQLKM